MREARLKRPHCTIPLDEEQAVRSQGSAYPGGEKGAGLMTGRGVRGFWSADKSVSPPGCWLPRNVHFLKIHPAVHLRAFSWVYVMLQ